ncbi:MAG: hypothetical protein UY04_C0001G0014 [Parcubacteria group bacterium GW2011_GWA2_47_7]|nr:MAG: hypothetical protein UY04_C0001G0014 [Parcubacteria group bacterium GW2011_GWA2_47_7]
MLLFVNTNDFLYDTAMTQDRLKSFKLPDSPGIYRFLDAKGRVLYIGKATSLRDRVRSYFSNDLLHMRGKHIVDMVTLARNVEHQVTDSVIEALILEASLIKRHQPFYNTREKDNRSWNYVVMTKEEFPRVLTIRERVMLSGTEGASGIYLHVFGPFTDGGSLNESLKIIRRILPFRDKCQPHQGKPCFNRQIGLCPGICSDEMNAREYMERIQEIRLFFEGKKNTLVKRLGKLMHEYATQQKFEEAQEFKNMIFSLQHIKDVSLLSAEVRSHSQKTSLSRSKPFRIEAYDVAHISGKYTVGVMTVVEDGKLKKSDYRKFKIRIESDVSNDTLHLDEVLRRRFGHKEWTKPDLVVVDGGTAQKRRAEKVLGELALSVDVVSVVKDARHKPKAILGNREIAESYKRGILLANAESHRFAVAYHRQIRDTLGCKKD